MKLFVLNSNRTPATKEYVLANPNVYGVTLLLPMSNFMFGAKFNEQYLMSLKDQIKHIADRGKKTALGILFGNSAHNIPGVDYIDVIESHHQGSGTKHSISVPQYNSETYFKYLEDFFQWLSSGLQKDSAWAAIEQIKITGINQETAECRVPDQDFSVIGDAYENAAKKWQSAGYSVTNTYEFMISLMDLLGNYFNEKEMVLPIIGGLNGFPCIDYNNNICTPHKRPDLSRQITNGACDRFVNVAPQWCALGASNTPPDYVFDKKNIIYQVETYVWGKPTVPYSEFQKVIDNARKYNCSSLEVMDTCLSAYPGMNCT